MNKIQVKLSESYSTFNDVSTGFFINKGEIKEVGLSLLILKAINKGILIKL